MKKNNSGRRGPLDSVLQNPPLEKAGWIRKLCGRGLFRDIWKNRFLVLRGDQLFICDREMKDLGQAEELLDLSDYDHCEEIRKNKSRSKKNHSKFRLLRCSSPGNTVPNLVFLAVSPEEKESWINVLNGAITRAKNRILDEVTVEDSQLSHLTRDRVKIPHNRRLPTRGHLLAVASTSSSDGTLTLDLIQEEESPQEIHGCNEASESVLALDCPRSKTEGSLCVRTSESSGKSRSLPRDVAVWEKTGSVQTPQSGKPLTASEKSRCASMDEILVHPDAKTTNTATAPMSRLQELIGQKLEKTERLLTEVQVDVEAGKMKAGKESMERTRAEAKRLLKEATVAWNQAHQVLEEVKELRALYQQLDPDSTKQNSGQKSLM